MAMCKKCRQEANRLIVKASNKVTSWYPESVFPLKGKSVECKAATMARLTAVNVMLKFKEYINKEGR